MKSIPNTIRTLIMPALIGAAIIFTMESFVLVSETTTHLNFALSLFDSGRITSSY